MDKIIKKKYTKIYIKCGCLNKIFQIKSKFKLELLKL